MTTFRDISPAIHVFSLTGEEEEERLDQVVSRHLGVPRSTAKKYILQQYCQVDGIICSGPAQRLREGQEITLTLPEVTTALQPEPGELPILYEDKYLAIINKPPGLTVHPCPSCPEGTLVQRLLTHFPQLSQQEGLRPGIVHRLDKDTSGLMVVALTEETRLTLTNAFANRLVQKHYLALCRGIVPTTGQSTLALGRHPTFKTKMAPVPETKGGRAASSTWQRLYADPAGSFSLVDIAIHTGRTHQIRVHMAEAGYPLWGDPTYGPHDPCDPALRQMLHAWSLSFTHPVTGEPMTFVQAPPDDFMSTAMALHREQQRLILTGLPGCGKSAVLAILEEIGIPTWSADKTVTSLYEPGADGWYLFQKRYGDAFIPDPSLPVDRGALSKALIEQPGLRQEIEAMIHPLVNAAMEQFFTEAEAAGNELAVAEVPLWHEGGAPNSPAKYIVLNIACPDATRYERIQRERQWSQEKVAAMDSWQWSAKSKEKASHATLPNDGNLDALKTKVHAQVDALATLRAQNKKALQEHLCDLWTSPRSIHPTNYQDHQ